MWTTTDQSPAWAAQRPRFLLVVTDPDPCITGELAAELARHQIDTEICHSPAEALLIAGASRPDAVLISAEQPSLSSVEIVDLLSRRAGIPVVVGIGGADGAEAAAVLHAGARACIARPYRVPELIPILRAIRPDSIGTMDPVIKCGALQLNPSTVEVRLHGRLIPLPLREYQVLRFLMNHVDRVVTREQIYHAVWGQAEEEGSNTLTVHVKRLRKRLGDDLKEPSIILTVRNIGYRLVPPQPQQASVAAA